MVSKRRAYKHGFTIIEMIVIVVVIVILATLVTFSFSSWRSRTAKTEVKTSLIDLATVLKNELNFNSKYPANLPTTYTPAKGVTVTYSSPSPYATYCAAATSKAVSTITMYISSSDPVPSETSC